MNKVIVGVGSNIDPLKNIELSRKKLAKIAKLLRSSKFIKTKPIGFANQPDFYNGAFLIETDKEMSEFKKMLKVIENELGRKRTSNKYGPRTIDLDILVWNGKITDEEVHKRDFLKQFIKELEPELEI